MGHAVDIEGQLAGMGGRGGGQSDRHGGIGLRSGLSTNNHPDPTAPEVGALDRVTVFVHDGDGRDRLSCAVAVHQVVWVIPSKRIAPGWSWYSPSSSGRW